MTTEPSTAAENARRRLYRAWFWAEPNQPMPEGKRQVDELLATIVHEASAVRDREVTALPFEDWPLDKQPTEYELSEVLRKRLPYRLVYAMAPQGDPFVQWARRMLTSAPPPASTENTCCYAIHEIEQVCPRTGTTFWPDQATTPPASAMTAKTAPVIDDYLPDTNFDMRVGWEKAVAVILGATPPASAERDAVVEAAKTWYENLAYTATTDMQEINLWNAIDALRATEAH